MINPEFEVHLLNPDGIVLAEKLASTFNECLNSVIEMNPSPSREMSLVRTHLEIASFFAKKAMAKNPANQKT